MIPVMRPKLPAAERLKPYLQAIDASRIYTNFGPLVCAFEGRLVEHFGLAEGMVTTVGNATLGLSLALAAQGARPGTLCAMPAWTFVASAHAATVAGLVPYFIDVDADSWAVDPDEIEDMIIGAPGEVGAVMPVMPFGRPIDVAAWDRFHTRSGVPVVIDAAAGFDAITPGAVPVVVSLHATKILGVGEGGLVMSTERALIHEIRIRSSFGFAGSRQAMRPAMNAKLSEFHAAVGLAGFDEWSVARAEWMEAARRYRGRLADSNLVRLQHGFGGDWIAATCNVSMSKLGALEGQALLAEIGIETRRWWDDGAHRHPATESFPKAPLPTTEALASSTIGLPFYRELDSATIDRICDRVLMLAGD